MTGRRAALDSVGLAPNSTHPGLWFDRYYRANGDEGKRDLMTQTATIGVSSLYKDFYDRWRAALPDDVQLAVAQVQGRMVVGTGDKGVAEAGITLHQTYGVPYMPGSALKGLASTYAATRLDRFAYNDRDKEAVRAPVDTDGRVQPGAYHTMFGAENTAGYITFFDALYIPASGHGCTPARDTPLQPDVITGHHSGYYVGDDPKPPADWDSPVPVPFLTVTGSYLIAVAGEAAWATRALEIIGMALRDIGIGAKTAAGYGRATLFDMDVKPIMLPAPAVAATTRAIPAAGRPADGDSRIGKKLDGLFVDAVFDDGRVQVQLPEEYNGARGVIAFDDMRGRNVQHKDRLNVIVIGTGIDTDGVIIIQLRRRWNKKELAEGKTKDL